MASEPTVDTITSVEAAVGHPDGEVLVSNDGKTQVEETLVYEYDSDGQFTGWHKEAA